MSYEVLLFIGGPADGERREVARGQPFWVVTTQEPVKIDEPTDMQPFTRRHAQYARVKFIDTNLANYDVMCHETAMSNPLQHLIDGYRKAR
ncbi:hypothetical protein ACVBR5_000855 [Burkholderia cenocepacia]